ncbi:MAG: helix-turn-helix domain-containing protein [Ktedonobacteraceae bacterium]
MIINEVFRKWRVTSEVSIRDAAQQIGISPATLNRFERGEDSNGKTLASILHWLLSEKGR